MTEAEAKWCPFVHLRSLAHLSERGGHNPMDRDLTCIGSACMAWRKQESREFAARAEAEFRRTGMRLESDEGFCGLAGKP